MIKSQPLSLGARRKEGWIIVTCSVSTTITTLVHRQAPNAHLGVLRFGNVDECATSGVDNVQKLHDGCAVVGDGRIALVVNNELVHTARTERRAHGIHNGLASVDVADQLGLALRRIRALLQQDDAGALAKSGAKNKKEKEKTAPKQTRPQHRPLRFKQDTVAQLSINTSRGVKCTGIDSKGGKRLSEKQQGQKHRRQRVFLAPLLPQPHSQSTKHPQSTKEHVQAQTGGVLSPHIVLTNTGQAYKPSLGSFGPPLLLSCALKMQLKHDRHIPTQCVQR
jgi:hypothetical protein